MSASGNDFVILDNRGENKVAEKDKSRFVRDICRRKTGVGADGVLLVENSEDADFRMRYFNSDGGEVEFCGNGARCIAYFAHNILDMPARLAFESIPGVISAEVDNNFVSIVMPEATEFEGPETLELNDEIVEYYFINTGVPHVVIFYNDIENAPVLELGRKIRFCEAFKPDGTNVDFIDIATAEDYDIAVRTYERGVEDETLACGTGVTAAALVAFYLEKLKPPARIKVALPDILTVNISPEGRPVLSGEVDLVFEGIYRLS